MGRKKARNSSYLGLLILIAIFILIGFGCSKKAPAKVITARFTDPIELEPQVSDKCIACHTKTNPINKLATPVSAGADTGG